MELIGDPGDGYGSISRIFNANKTNIILDICNLSRDDTMSLSYKVSNKKTYLSKGHQILLGVSGHYQPYSWKTDKTFKPFSWLSVGQDMFN